MILNYKKDKYVRGIQKVSDQGKYGRYGSGLYLWWGFRYSREVYGG
jgi:hypothetical protein